MDFDILAFRPFVFLLRFFSFVNNYCSVSHFLGFKKSENAIAKRKLGFSNRIEREQNIP